MKNLLLAFVLVCVALPVFANQDAKLMGKWINQGRQGATVVEFTPNAMSLTPVDAAGKPVDEPQSVNVTYGGSDSVIKIVLAGGEGTFQATLQDRDTMVLSIPGLLPAQYKRVKNP
jgi:hypothetical protein